MFSIIHNIPTTYTDSMSAEEAAEYVDCERLLWAQKNKELGGVTLKLEGDEVVITAREKSPIIRVRRLTGYLSRAENINPAKQSEIADRETHFSMRGWQG